MIQTSTWEKASLRESECKNQNFELVLIILIRMTFVSLLMSVSTICPDHELGASD